MLARVVIKTCAWLCIIKFSASISYQFSCSYSLPDHPLSVPTTLDPLGLSILVNELLKAKDEEWREVSFDFLIDGTLLRLTLDEHIKSQSLSTVRDALVYFCVSLIRCSIL